jgi:cephalosporin hydroxylase
MFKSRVRNYTNKVKFSVKTIEKGHHNVSFQGVPMIKCPFDYLIYQMLVWEVKPDLIIEIGTNLGGSAFYFANMLDNMGQGIVHTIDIIDQVRDQRVLEHPRIKRFFGGYQSYGLNNAHNFQRVLVVDDGSHLYEDVYNALEKFKNLINENSYYIVEDGIIDELGMTKSYKGGPNKAIKEFLEKNNSFQIDTRWTNFFGQNATFNTNGYLKRV